MTKRERWALILLAVAVAVFYISFPRYVITTQTNGLYRWDRWTGRMEVTYRYAFKNAPWVTITSDVAEPAVGADVTGLMNAPATK